MQEIEAELREIDKTIEENLIDIERLSRDTTELKDRSSKLNKKRLKVKQVSDSYQQLLENISKEKENIQNIKKNKEAIIEYEIKNKEGLEEHIKDKIQEAIEKIDGMIKEKTDDKLIKRKEIIENDVEKLGEIIKKYEHLINLPRNIDEDIKKIKDIRSRIEKEENTTKLWFLLEKVLKPVYEKKYDSVEEMEAKLFEAQDAAEKAKTDLIEKQNDLKKVRSELDVKQQEKKSLKNNREIEIIKLLE